MVAAEETDDDSITTRRERDDEKKTVSRLAREVVLSIGALSLLAVCH
jgi:hypothetical protein